jgi:hypothetical protein
LYLDTSVGEVDPVASAGVVSVASLLGLEVGVGNSILDGVTVLVVGGNLEYIEDFIKRFSKESKLKRLTQ